MCICPIFLFNLIEKSPKNRRTKSARIKYYLIQRCGIKFTKCIWYSLKCKSLKVIPLHLPEISKN